MTRKGAKSKQGKLLENLKTETSSSRRNKKAMKWAVATEVKPPASAGVVVGYVQPRITSNKDSTFVTGVELMQPLVTTATATLSLNQALIPSTATWLDGVARNFSLYKWHFLRYIYLPQCPTGTTGGFTLGVQYETSENAPTTQKGLSASLESVTSSYWGGMPGVCMLNDPASRHREAVYVDVDVRKAKHVWYPYKTATNYAATTPVDRNMFSIGQVVAVTDGGPTPALAVAGNIFIQYKVELIDPVDATTNT